MKFLNLKLSLVLFFVGLSGLSSETLADPDVVSINGDTYIFDFTDPRLYNNPTADPLFSYSTDPTLALGQSFTYFFGTGYINANVHKCIPSNQSISSYFPGAVNITPQTINICEGIENQQGAIQLNFNNAVSISDLTLTVAIPLPVKINYQFPYSTQTYTAIDSVFMGIGLGWSPDSPLVASCTSSVGQIVPAKNNALGAYAEVLVINDLNTNFNTNSLDIHIHCQTPVRSVFEITGGGDMRAGVLGVGVSDNVNLINGPPQFAFITRAVVGHPAASKPILSLSNVDITQAVNNFTVADIGQIGIGAPGSSGNPFALVQNRNAVILATLNVANGVAGDQTPVIVTATLPDGSTYSSAPIAMSSIASNGSPVVIGPMPINSSPGKYTITVKPAASNAISQVPTDGSSNGLATVKINQTNPLSIDYFSMSYSSSGSTVPVISESVLPADFNQHITKANQVLQGMYPVAENGIDFHVGLPLTSVAPSLGLSGANAANADLAMLAYHGTIINPGGQAAVGIVSRDYFTNRGLPTALGVAFPSTSPCNNKITRGALVIEGQYPVTAHEIGHTFGLGDAITTVTDGFWVNSLLPLTGFPGLMIDKRDANIVYPNYWPTKNDYACFYTQLSKTNIDPQTILVSGSIDKKGKVNMMPLVFLPNGIETPPSASDDGKIQLLDSQGAIVSESSFMSNYNLVGDDGSIYPVNSTYFIAQVPYSQNVVSIKIQQGSKTLLNIDPNADLLTSAIKNIAPTSFKKNPVLGKTLLMSQVQLINSLMKTCNRVKKRPWETRCDNLVLISLLNLRRSINSLLNDSTLITSADQVLKPYALNVVDIIALGSLPNISVPARKQAMDIRILPFGSEKEDVGFSIQSVTQGSNGAVYINNNGTVEYSPYTNSRRSDQFTVVIKDKEGDLVTKTISIVAPNSKSNDDKGEVGNVFHCR